VLGVCSVLPPILAWLEYRWLKQLSAAEQVRRLRFEMDEVQLRGGQTAAEVSPNAGQNVLEMVKRKTRGGSNQATLGLLTTARL
jgi:hypothetical protein